MTTCSDGPSPGDGIPRNLPLARLIVGALNLEACRYWTAQELGITPQLAPRSQAVTHASMLRLKPIGRFLAGFLPLSTALVAAGRIKGDAIDLFESAVREECLPPPDAPPADITARDWNREFQRKSGKLKSRDNPYEGLEHVAPVRHLLYGAAVQWMQQQPESYFRVTFKDFVRRRTVLVDWQRAGAAETSTIRTAPGGAVYLQGRGHGAHGRISLDHDLSLLPPPSAAALREAVEYPIHPLRQRSYLADRPAPDRVRVQIPPDFYLSD